METAYKPITSIVFAILLVLFGLISVANAQEAPKCGEEITFDTETRSMAELPTIEISEARMVSASVLGIDAMLGFPDSDREEGPRYVELRATINGQSVRENIEVTDLVGPGESIPIKWVYTERLQINLANTKDEEGNPVRVPRFTRNEKFDLEAIAWSSASGRSQIAVKEVEILLPVIIVHGWSSEHLIPASVPFHIYGDLIARLKVEGYSTDASGYKTIWFKRYSSQTWSPEEVSNWLDNLVGEAINATYAERVNIIGHSLGGLVGRYYITNHLGTSKVHKLIMVGTPSKGSSIFYTLTSGLSIDGINRKLDRSPLLQWAIPIYQALYSVEHEPLPPPIPNNFPDKPAPEGVTYYSIYSMGTNTPYGLIVEPCRGWYKVIDKRYYQTQGDGLVPWESANLDGAINKPLLVYSRHSFLPKNPIVQNAIIESLED